MNTKPSILAIDDEEDILLLYKTLLKDTYNITTMAKSIKAIELIKNNQYDLILLDVIMPEINGIDTLKKIKEMDNSIDVIMVTASKDIKPAVDSLKLGASDYITKPFETDALLASIKRVIEHRQIKKENIYLRQTLDEQYSYGKLIGKSKQIMHIYNTIESISDSDSTVLITGESGTGKEIVAKTIHDKSKRTKQPYVVVNCAAIPENLLESELFGHEKGAFTGALERHIGKFELADGGTLFLDEIGEMPLNMQAKLLRVVQEKNFMRVGGEKAVHVDVRIIAATNIDVQKAIQDKKFREDLFYRLNVIPIYMFPLRERIEDLPLFINFFINKYNKELNKNIKKMSAEVIKTLNSYYWPGNIRELENLIERIVTLSKEETIELINLPQEIINGCTVKKDPFHLEENSIIKATLKYEKSLILNALSHCDQNQTAAAKLLGIHRTTLISKMRNLGITD